MSIKVGMGLVTALGLVGCGDGGRSGGHAKPAGLLSLGRPHCSDESAFRRSLEQALTQQANAALSPDRSPDSDAVRVTVTDLKLSDTYETGRQGDVLICQSRVDYGYTVAPTRVFTQKVGHMLGEAPVDGGRGQELLQDPLVKPTIDACEATVSTEPDTCADALSGSSDAPHAQACRQRGPRPKQCVLVADRVATSGVQPVSIHLPPSFVAYTIGKSEQGDVRGRYLIGDRVALMLRGHSEVLGGPERRNGHGSSPARPNGGRNSP